MKNLVTWFEYQHQAKSYDRHFVFVNFTQYQRYERKPLYFDELLPSLDLNRYTKNLKPTYINMIRDPAEREYSAFRGRRSQDPLQITQEIKRRDAMGSGTGSCTAGSMHKLNVTGFLTKQAWNGTRKALLIASWTRIPSAPSTRQNTRSQDLFRTFADKTHGACK